MTRLRVLLQRLAATFGGRRRDEELTEEIRHHLDLLVDEFRGRGLPEQEAADAARREFGGVMQVREAYRQQRRLPPLDDLLSDVRFAVRALVRDRASTIAAVALLSVGIGATVLMADTLDRLLLRPPAHVADPERVARVYSQTDNSAPSAMISNYATLTRFSDGLRDEVEFMAAYATERLSLGRGPDSRRLEVVAHSRAYFEVLGLVPATGTLPGSRAAGFEEAAVISHGLWHRQFGGSPDAIGRTLRLGRRLYTIVAVAPRGFHGIDTEPADVWLPIESRAADGLLDADWRVSDGYYRLNLIARLRAGVEPAHAELRASAVYNAGPTPEWMDGRRRQYRIIFGELHPARRPGGTHQTRILIWLGGVSALVLLIACGNVGNLLLLRGLRRSGELALKTAIGATRARLMREVLLEGCVLALAAGTAGLLLLLTVGTVVSRRFLSPALAAAASVDGRVILVTAITCAAAALLLGLLPAIRLTSGATLGPARGLQPRRSSRLLDAFVALQVALSVPLIVGASLFSVSLWKARQIDFGLDAANVVVISVDAHELGGSDASGAAHRRIQERLALLPQVQSAALVQPVPFVSAYALIMSIPGVTMNGPLPCIHAADPAYFDVMGLRFVEGRRFSQAENRLGSRPVLVINESMARTFWPGESPLGRCVRIGGGDEAPCSEVIGVVANAVMWPSLQYDGDAPPMYYVPAAQRPTLGMHAVLLRTTGDPAPLLSLIRNEALGAASNLPYVDIWALDDVFQPALRPLRLGSTIFVAFGVLGLLIAMVGLAAVTAYGVTRRTKELGIRLILGADPRGLIARTLLRSFSATAVGVAAGSALALGGSRWVRALLFGVEEGDIRIYASAAVLLLLVSLVAAFVPARRAGRIDPAVALRTE